jgi:hypothetical protein
MCAFDRLGKFCATYVDWRVIELWDVGSLPLLSSILFVPASLTNRTDGHCHCLAWSFNAKHMIGVFGSKSNRKGVIKERNLLVWEISSGNVIRHFKYFVKSSFLFAFLTNSILLFQNPVCSQFVV